jgi:hypothetical protein
MRLGGGNAALRVPAEFRSRVNLFNTCVSDCLCRNLARVPAVPNGLAGLPLADWNGPATQLDNEHRPLVRFEAAGLGDFIVAKMAERKGVASNGLRGYCERLPSVPDVV